MSQKKAEEIHIGEMRGFDGELNQCAICNVVSADGEMANYTIWISRAFCDWVSRNITNGYALAIGMAVTMRLTWDEICDLKYADLLFDSSGVWVSNVTYTGDIPFLSGRYVNRSRVTVTWVLERFAYLCACGYTPAEILDFPVMSRRNNPMEAATADELVEYARGMIEAFAEESIEDIYKVTAEEGAII